MSGKDLLIELFKKYSSCTSYHDSGELKTSVIFWGDISFETFFSAPSNLMVRFKYGPSTEPLLTETFWTNGDLFYCHSAGALNECLELSKESFFEFGLGVGFDFVVPEILVQRDSSQFHCLADRAFEINQNQEQILFISKNSDEYGREFSFEMSIDAETKTLRKTSSTEGFCKGITGSAKKLAHQFFPSTELSSKQIRNSAAPPSKRGIPGTQLERALSGTEKTKLQLLMGKPGVFQLSDISVSCSYNVVQFDIEIPANLFSFKPKVSS